MERKPIEALVEEYKDADRLFVDLLKLAVKTFSPSTARKHKLPVSKKQDRQQAKAEYERKGGDREFKEVGRLRKDLRRAIAEQLAQQPTWDAAISRILEDIEEYILVRRKAEHHVQDLGKIPCVDGKAVRPLLRKWFGPGSYDVDYVRDGFKQSLVRVDI